MRNWKSSLNKKLIKEYIELTLKEDDAGGNPAFYGGFDSGMVGPYGVSFGSREDLVNTFITPFLDVFKTTIGKTKELARKTQTLVWVGLQTVLTSLIPIYGYNYAEVFDKEKKDIEKIRNEYKDVYERTNKALSGSDAAMIAFMASPAIVLGAIGARQSAKSMKNLLSAASGGFSDELYGSTRSKLKSAGRWMLGDDGSKSASNSKTSSSDLGESILREEDEDNSKKKMSPKDILTNRKFIKKSLDNQKTREMQAAATRLYKKSLNDVYAQAEDVLKNAKTVEDLEKSAKKNIPQVEEIKNLPQDQKAAAEKKLIDGVRKAMKDFYVKNLTAQVNQVMQAGIPKEAQYVQDYLSTISKIKSL